MNKVPLAAVPNQTVSFNADGAFWSVHVYQGIMHMCADISNGSATIASGIRCFGGIPLLQYEYMTQPNFGNFVFDSDADWTNFGATCNLYYLEQPEVANLNSLLLASPVA